MTKPTRLVVILFVCGTVFGCTITQTAEPVALTAADAMEICVIEDSAVFPEFLAAYKMALEKKGFVVKVLPPTSGVTSCPLSSTYYARRSWDFVTYLSHAKVFVYRDGRKAGKALYDAPKAGSALTPRIYESTESKVATMVAQLFPATARR